MQHSQAQRGGCAEGRGKAGTHSTPGAEGQCRGQAQARCLQPTRVSHTSEGAHGTQGTTLGFLGARWAAQPPVQAVARYSPSLAPVLPRALAPAGHRVGDGG